MNFENLKKWRPMMALLPIIWLGLYLWAWMAREGCGMTPIGECWVSAFGSWGADVVMFTWMDTTLGAGIFAASAAAGALLTVFLQRSYELQNQADMRIERAVGTVGLIREKLSSIIDDTQRLADKTTPIQDRHRRHKAVENAVSTIGDLLPNAYAFGPEFGAWYGHACSEIRERWAQCSTGDDVALILRFLATLYANQAIVRDIRNLAGPDGYYRRAKIVLDPGEVAVFQALGLKVADVVSARRYVQEI